MRFWFYMLRAIYRDVAGRLYVWRDVPDDIVREVAVLWYKARKRPFEEGTHLIFEAYKEYKLRKRKNGRN